MLPWQHSRGHTEEGDRRTDGQGGVLLRTQDTKGFTKMSNIRKYLAHRNPVIDDENSDDLVPWIYFKSTKYVWTAGAEEFSQTSEKSFFRPPLRAAFY